MRIILVSLSRTTFDWIESGKAVYHAPNAGTSRVLLGWDEIFALYLIVTPAVQSSIDFAPNPRWRFPGRNIQSHHLLPGAYNDSELGSYNPQSSPHFPGPLLANLELFADMTAASCSAIVSVRGLIAVINREWSW